MKTIIKISRFARYTFSINLIRGRAEGAFSLFFLNKKRAS